MKPVRWLLMASHVPPSGSLGGIVRYTVELARALERRDDVELHLLTSPEAEQPLADLLGCHGRTVAVPRVPGALVPAVERYLLGRRLRGFDVVQGTKHLLPRGVAARSVLTVHDMLLFDRPQDFPTAKRHLLRQPYAASLRGADVLACVSAATERRVLEWSPRLAGRTVVAPLATGSALLSTPATPVAAVAGRPFALVVGDSQPRKNVATVVSAWQRVVQAHPDALLVLVGPPAWGRESYGPGYPALTASGHVLQLTGIDDGTLRWCYENAAVVLAPSLAEGFGLPAVEALDLGAPLVTSLDAALVEASGAHAEHLPAHDVTAWAESAADHLAVARDGSRRTPRRARTWDDVAADTVAGVLRR
ncbi:glycosyltransferase family 1 protein [Kineococcus gypseus]|uniref:glycosyltransferase family 4 protein n=1 Tax=Kineococcus gypseus TaxID=1637102 RepID=UPI003D7E4FA6